MEIALRLVNGEYKMGPIKATVKHLVNRMGFDIVRIADNNSTAVQSRGAQAGAPPSYESVRPTATYSPWNKDDAFRSVFASIEMYSLVDRYRCYELWTLVEQVAKLKTGSLIEVGVWRGGTGAIIAKQAKRCGIQDKVFLCDTFAGVVKAGTKDSSYKNGAHADTSRRAVEELIFARMNLDNVEILEGIFPDQTGYRVENLQFRFCHIDVDVYQSAKDIVDCIWDKLVPGGIIVYDDYGFQNCDGITRYVDEQIGCRDRLIIHNLNGHAIVMKV